jgi:hypothetical protein
MDDQALLESHVAPSRGTPIVVKRLDEKQYQNYRARAALMGCTLIRTNDDLGREVFIIARGALCKELDGAESIEAWLKRLVGGSAV